MLKVIIFAVMTICSISANAASWKFLSGVYSKQFVGYFDADTIIKKNNTVTIWVKYVNNPNTPDSTGAYSTAQHTIFNCKQKTYKILSISSYDKTQQFIGDVSVPGPVTDVVPGTISENELDAVCKAGFPKGETTVTNNDVYASTYNYFAAIKDSDVDFAPHSKNWFAFNKVASDAVAYYFDADSIVRKGDIVTLWVKYVMNPDLPVSNGVYSAALKYNIDCNKKLMQPLTVSTYDKNQKFILSDSNAAANDPPTEGSLADVMLQAVCSPNFPNSGQTDLYFPIPGGDIYARANSYFEYIKEKKSDPAPK